MKRSLIVIVIMACVMMVPGIAKAATFTLDQSDLLLLYDMYAYPSTSGTNSYLSPLESIPGGVKYKGNVNTGAGSWPNPRVFSLLSIGANVLGTDRQGNGSLATPGSLGISTTTLSAYDKYALMIGNANEHAWTYEVFFSTVDTKGTVDMTDDIPYLILGDLVSIPVGDIATVALNFTDADVIMWTGTDWDITNVNNNNVLNTNIISGGYLSNPNAVLTSIGFSVGGDVPVGLGQFDAKDYTFETVVRPVPEPATAAMLGMGLLGLLGTAVRRFKA